MDDAAPANKAEGLHIAVRAEQIWRDRRAKGFSITNKQLAVRLDAEGYQAPAAHIIRMWVQGWQEADGVLKQDDSSPEGMLALQAETLAHARAAFSNGDIRALETTMAAMRDATKAISEHIVANVGKVEIKTPADIDALAATMGRLAESAERISRAGDFLRSRQVAATSDGRPVRAEIIGPDDEEDTPPSYALSALQAFQRDAASA